MAGGQPKTARLDHVLLDLGYVTETQISRALQRQKAHGGRLGMHLVRGGDLTPTQLAEALSIQFDLPWVPTVERDAPEDLLAAMPPGAVTDHLTLPMAWDPGSQTLRLVVADPTDAETIQKAKAAFGARRVSVVLAPEPVLRERVSLLTGRKEAPADIHAPPVVEFPELFHYDEDDQQDRREGEEDAGERPRSLLMVSPSASHKNFLPTLFDREGCGLVVASNVEQVRDALSGVEYDAVLVHKELAETFSGWVKQGTVPAPRAEVNVFTSVSASLLENPVSYDAMSQSVQSAVQALSEKRWADGDQIPSHGLVADDLALLADRFGLRRIVRDGLQLAAHLLAPATPAQDGEAGHHRDPFTDFAESLDLAARLHFPFKLDELLAGCHALYHERATPAERGFLSEEAHLAAQMLAIVWFRHHAVQLDDEGDAALRTVLGAALRKQAGRLASLELVEVYLRLLAERGGATVSVERDVLLVGDERIFNALSARLARVGSKPVTSEDLVDARTVLERRAPAAIIIDAQRFGEHTARFVRIARLDGNLLLYALIDSADPATTLALLDAGADDVFQPEHDFDLIAARVSRAVRTRSRRAEPAGFSASFSVFSFLDLVQALSQARKTARIELTRGRESAELFLHNGVMEHAECGDAAGVEAVYRVIAWEEDGEFTVHPGQTARLRTIHEATDAVLMEGCRLLDESRTPV